MILRDTKGEAHHDSYVVRKIGESLFVDNGRKDLRLIIHMDYYTYVFTKTDTENVYKVTDTRENNVGYAALTVSDVEKMEKLTTLANELYRQFDELRTELNN